MREIPVYLFTGFLESGKTKFIQETLEDPRFNTGEKTLVLLCEEGIEEYDVAKMPGKNVYVHSIEEKSDLSKDKITALVKKTNAERVIIEYNGMWLLNELFDALPQNFVLAQEFCFMDSTTIMSYNSNMRQLVFDKLSTAELVIFNRVKLSQDVQPYHKLVRAISRRADIIYEFTDGSILPDNIEDPLPFDVNAKVIEIEDRDYAIWFQDMMNDMEKYTNKTIKFKGIVARDAKLPNDTLIVGRQVMNCCAEDIQYCGIACDWKDASTFKTNDWVVVTAKLSVGVHKLYRSKGPYLTAISVEKSEPPVEQVATFY